MSENLHEECGVFGIYNRDNLNVVSSCYYALYALQHRGQESCGIAINNRGLIRNYKDNGLVNEVFTPDTLAKMGNGNIAIAHTRYGTTGSSMRRNAQPLVVNHVKGAMALCHNGNLTNAGELKETLELRGSIFHTSSDTEVISYIITGERLKSRSIEEAVSRAMDKLEGAYSLVIMSPSKLIAARDPYGFRPLCMGRIGSSTVFASETCALDSIGAEFIRDIEPGEIVVVDKTGIRSDVSHVNTKPKSLCVFEYIYFARPDSVVDGASVHNARRQAGAFLAQEHPVEADVVIGVPDSGIDAAIGYSQESGIPYGMGFLKNKYIGRTFIQPTQSDREDKVRIKLNPVASVVNGKRVVMVDDSIVRGTTCARIVRLLRNAGAKEVHMRSSAPPFMYPCWYGTDIDSQDSLIACKYDLEGIREKLGVDSIGYLSIEHVRQLTGSDTGFCCACFDGKYPCNPPKKPLKSKFEFQIPEENT